MRLVRLGQARIETNRVSRGLQALRDRLFSLVCVAPLHELTVGIRDTGPGERVAGLHLDRLLEVHQGFSQTFLRLETVTLASLQIEIVCARVTRTVVRQVLCLCG